MEFQAKLCFTFLGIICSSLLHLLYSRKLEGYEFPVYSTEFCPRNRSEWDQRSSAINCTEGNGYMCLPNESLTHLLEFCYIYPRLVISKDLCLFLIKRYSRVDSYNCSRFTHGCPTSTYFSSKIFEHPNCIHIENGCFWAEPTCQSSTISYAPKTTNSMPEETVQINSTTTFFQETKRYVEKTTLRREVQNDHNNDNYGWILVAVFLGVLILICGINMIYLFYRIKIKIRRRNTDEESCNKEEHLPLCEHQHDGTKSNKDIPLW
ncbi:uncharacterized protein LOC128179443 isoform X8 [Crassostrea angulata]|uniref:uncharacterized protein LOC128179443 isoform X8 n=1 Tax=Magallana angulata TaxID=2784310 RepID=UPI0022B1120A|nr:uncharacterized protein LOC128179443 isoform X8 [Crassostrea angulata]